MTPSPLIVIADRHLLDSQLLAASLARLGRAEVTRPAALVDVDVSRADLVLLDARAADDVFDHAVRHARAVGLLWDYDDHLLRARAASGQVKLLASRQLGLEEFEGLVRRVLNGQPATALPRANRDSVATPLSPRENEVLRLMAHGLGNHAIARTLCISPHTVRTHVQAVLTKLDRSSRLSAVSAARRAGLLSQ